MQLQSADGGGVGGLRRVPEGALERLAATHRVVDARAEQRVFVAFLSEAALRTAADPWRVVRVVSGLWVVYALFIVRGVVRGVVRGRAPRRR
jgi:hypothetical protein